MCHHRHRCRKLLLLGDARRIAYNANVPASLRSSNIGSLSLPIKQVSKSTYPLPQILLSIWPVAFSFKVIVFDCSLNTPTYTRILWRSVLQDTQRSFNDNFIHITQPIHNRTVGRYLNSPKVILL